MVHCQWLVASVWQSAYSMDGDILHQSAPFEYPVPAAHVPHLGLHNGKGCHYFAKNDLSCALNLPDAVTPRVANFLRPRERPEGVDEELKKQTCSLETRPTVWNISQMEKKSENRKCKEIEMFSITRILMTAAIRLAQAAIGKCFSNLAFVRGS